MSISYKIVFFLLLSACFFSCNDEAILHPTFSKNIAPIIYAKCTPCHRPNQIGHFNLITYNDVATKAEAIKYTVTNRLMPPWPADIHYSRFANEMVLEDKEIVQIQNWIKNKCPIGDEKYIPALPNYAEKSFIGKPDLVVPIKPNLIHGDFQDQFLLVKVPFTLPTENYAHTIEFVPGNTKVVHHVNADIIRYNDAKKVNVFDGNWIHNTVTDSTVRDAYLKMGLLHDDGSYPTLHRNAVNYLPGVIAQEYPDGIGDIKLGRKNAFLLSDLHYGPFWDDVTDSSYINIFFSKAPPNRVVQEFQLGTLGIVPVSPALQLPPNKITTVHSQYVLPKPISIITLNPHMHLLGKSFWAFAVLPNADTIPLIKINNWDFNWQNYYKPKTAIILPAGTLVYAQGVYDNTENNVFNPNKPPKLVTDKNGTMRTTDEMFQFIVSYLDYQVGDEKLQLDKKN
jgi:hypothetical protein